MSYNCYIVVVLLSFLSLSCKEDAQVQLPLFNNLSSERTGVNFKNTLNNSRDLNILNYIYYYNGAGVSLTDFNNDGLVDIYLSANQNQDRLYLNLGEFKFQDITNESGIDNGEGWTTGINCIDINNDGLMDFYVCKVGMHLNLQDHNLLYVNQGLINNKPHFKEESKKYGLDITSYATQSAFFDYDLDGDLDMYLLNHSVSPNANYGKGTNRQLVDSLSGDKFFENENGRYIDVSTKVGIFQGKIGYGLGLSIADINNDGYPDIYVGNDFFENDYLYINQKNKSFKEIISTNPEILGHTSHYSMGNSLSDFNNDGLVDIISLDMLPEDLHNYKTSGLDYPYPTYNSYLRNGYSPQFMQNTFHLNSKDGNFRETAHLSGMAATEWSWAPLSADFDNDGYKDLYITNGIIGATNDMDFINFISNDQIQSQLGKTISDEHMKFIDKLPSKHIENYFFKNSQGEKFLNFTKEWTPTGPSYSSGAAYADLDNDGDLDLVINNTNETAFILENTTDSLFPKKNYLQIKLTGPEKNINGIGVKVIAFGAGKIQAEENQPTRGFLSSTSPEIHMGLGEIKEIDSLQIIWPAGSYETIINQKSNSRIIVDIKNASGNFYGFTKKLNQKHFKDSITGVDFVHKDRTSLEFIRDPLLPYASTNEGPDISVADVNNDGLDDFFISGAKGQPSKLYIQNPDGSFSSHQDELFLDTSINEDTAHSFFDYNNDQWLDLIVASGGNEFKTGKPLSPRIYVNDSGKFRYEQSVLPEISVNASKVLTGDINKDGFEDIIITADSENLIFGKTPEQYILLNGRQGKFVNKTKQFSPELSNLGNIKDGSLVDIDKDGDLDLVVVGHWMPISILINENGKFTLQKNTSLGKTHGWWNTIEIKDFDNDGDLDFMVGNWGLNSRLSASLEKPITLYNFDFDNNGKIDPMVTYHYKGEETIFATKDDLVKQLPYINKEYLSYSDFAYAKIEDILGSKNLRKATKKYAYELASCYFENVGNLEFRKTVLPFMAQVSSIFDVYSEDFNNDGYFDVLLTGNNFEISTQLSRLDASHGELFLLNENDGFTYNKNRHFDISGPVRALADITINNSKYLIVGRNGDSPIFIKIEKKENENE